MTDQSKNVKVKLGIQTALGMIVARGYTTLIDAETEVPTVLFTPHPATPEYIELARTYMATMTDPQIIDAPLQASPVPAVPAVPLQLSEPEAQMNAIEFDLKHHELLIPVAGETVRESVVRRMRYIKTRIEYGEESKVNIGRGLGKLLCSWTSEELSTFIELVWDEEFISVKMMELKDFIFENDLIARNGRR